MVQHVSAMAEQIQKDCYFVIDIPKTTLNIEKTEPIFYALGRFACVLSMTGSLLRGLTDTKPLNLAMNIGSFVFAHDLFQFLKNRQELPQNQLGFNKVVAMGKSMFSGGKTFLKSVLEGKGDIEAAMNAQRAAYNEVAALQSKNTLLQPVWNELQFQLAIRGYNPLP